MSKTKITETIKNVNNKVNVVLDDGESTVTIIDDWLNPQKSKYLFDLTMTVDNWFRPSYNFDGKIVTPERRMHSFGDDNVDTHGYSGNKIVVNPWNINDIGKSWKMIRDRIYKETGIYTNAVLLNYYPNGKSSITRHNDKEVIINETRPLDSPVIGLSLGATRRFTFRKIKGLDSSNLVYKVEINAFNGQLMIMGEGIQLKYTHEIPKEENVKEPRISGTFRMLPTV